MARVFCKRGGDSIDRKDFFRWRGTASCFYPDRSRKSPFLRKVVAAVNGQRYGFAAEAELSRTLVALIAGLAMGYRSGKEIADVIGADRLWREVLRARVTQIDERRDRGASGNIEGYALW